MNEFETIEKYFAPLTMGYEGSAGLCDDAAVLEIPEGHELVVTSDTLNEGIHFLEGEAPENIARKALRVNLSDLAAMAATPLCYQLNLAFPEKPTEAWLRAFTDALYEDNESFHIFCSGGDTTSIKGGALSISMTAMGTVPKGTAVRRGGAKAGDAIILTESVGDAVLGLKLLQGGLDKASFSTAIERYRVPRPRTQTVDILRKYAHAAADISDGLIADCLHIAKASNLCAEIDIEKIKFSQAVERAIDQKIITLEQAIKGGDDYELVLAVPDQNVALALSELQKINLKPLVIGHFKDSDLSLEMLNSDGLQMDQSAFGWTHF
mgnify:FL=1